MDTPYGPMTGDVDRKGEYQPRPDANPDECVNYCVNHSQSIAASVVKTDAADDRTFDHRHVSFAKTEHVDRPGLFPVCQAGRVNLSVDPQIKPKPVAFQSNIQQCFNNTESGAFQSNIQQCCDNTESGRHTFPTEGVFDLPNDIQKISDKTEGGDVLEERQAVSMIKTEGNSVLPGTHQLSPIPYAVEIPQYTTDVSCMKELYDTPSLRRGSVRVMQNGIYMNAQCPVCLSTPATGETCDTNSEASGTVALSETTEEPNTSIRDSVHTETSVTDPGRLLPCGSVVTDVTRKSAFQCATYRPELSDGETFSRHEGSLGGRPDRAKVNDRAVGYLHVQEGIWVGPITGCGRPVSSSHEPVSSTDVDGIYGDPLQPSGIDNSDNTETKMTRTCQCEGKLFADGEVCDCQCKTCFIRQACDSSVRHHTCAGNGEESHGKNISDDGFTDPSVLERRSVTHTGEKTFICDICEKSFTKPRTLKKHSRTHIDQKRFICKICDKKFTHPSVLKQHSATHANGKSFSCKDCEKTFTKESTLRKHSVIHTGKRRFACILCEKSFSSPSGLKQHTVTHTGQKLFACNICEKGFSQQSTLRRHSLIHTGEKPFVCKICDKRFTHPSTFKQHTVTHTGDRPFVCKICDHGFADPSNLKRHMLTHTGEKHFVCKMCDKSFANPFTLKQHTLLHTGQKPFVCDICEKTFRHRTTWKQHSMTHTDERPFSCKMCDKTFKYPTTLKHHLLLHK